ncbi:DEAD/DEAH box helicase family protein [Pseudoalteromonas rubra]|uniref:DEAD/DEAH box helicase n=1 Tax=Pseudoalteromonas rubra TaxID=43658 RepID=A0A5S3X5A0_9GAMM|nr:DEAD/DEAH box helicase family protein [Pseudoalteromonas rubra]TMP39742.1 DEAD/DEAH box helicase [Pseudoalteromonas rubra]
MNSFSQNTVLQNSTRQLTTGGTDPLLPKLVHAINHADEIEITVSFIQPSGLSLLFDPLLEALRSGAQLKLLTSDYLDITSPVALRELMTLVERGADIRIYESDKHHSFHMKSYIFVKTQQNSTEIAAGCAFIGSNNISKSALTTGLEWCFRHDYTHPPGSKGACEFNHIRRAFAELFAHNKVKTLSHSWIDTYIQRRKAPQFIVAGESEDDSDAEPVTPRADQQLALDALAETRRQGFKRGLMVLATGMGKTWLSVFDAQQMHAKRILFVAHREEILTQAQRTFARLLQCKTGLYTGKQKDSNADCLFASVQTLGQARHLQRFAPEHFDYIVVDEFHHASARVYRALLNYFTPQFLLGLTATPERTDQADILGLCDNNLVFERNLTQGIDNGTLVPFQYYGIWDQDVDYTAIPWCNGRFDPDALENQFATSKRAAHALKEWQARKQQRTLAFCISKRHAEHMAGYFNDAGVKALAVHSDTQVRRNDALKQLEQGQVEILFSVDLFNEGTDLPSIDTVLMLRPSDSKILFLQQLGRGLRTCEGKTHLTVLDFIGNHHSFLNKPAALLNAQGAKGVTQALKAPKLPEGCFINFDLEITDFWQQLAKIQRTTALEDYEHLAQLLGHNPSASEFYRHYGDLKKVNKQHGSWFAMLADIGDEINADWLAPYADFLFNAVQQTSMTKCFKAILLQAFIRLDGFRAAPTLSELAKVSAAILARYPHLKAHDLPEPKRTLEPDSHAWFSYWLGNPIEAFTGLKKAKQGITWFKVEKNGEDLQAARLVANVHSGQLPEQDIDKLADCVAELIELRLAEYTQRIENKRISELQAASPELEQASDEKEPDIPVQQSEPDSNNVVKLPYFPNLKIACGHFKTGDDSDMTWRPAPERAGRVDPDRHFLAHASGNSMNGGKNPILDGDLLLLERISSDNAGSITGTTIAIERFDGSGDAQFLLRDVQKEYNEQGEVRYLLVARNTDYETIIADESLVTFARFIK